MDNSLTLEELQKQLMESAIPLDVNDYHFNDDMVSVDACNRCVPLLMMRKDGADNE